MEEQTTTDTNSVDTGVQETQPVTQTDDGAADNSTADQQQTTDTSGNEPDSQSATPDVDDKLAKYAASQGLELDSPNAIKAARIAMQNQAEVTRNYQKANELQKTLGESHDQNVAGLPDDDASQLRAEIQGIKLQNNVNDFFANNPEAKALESTMESMVRENPTLGQLVAAGYLSLSDLHNMARGSDPTVASGLKEQGGKEALQKFADTQLGKANPGAATTAAFAPADKADPFREALLGKL